MLLSNIQILSINVNVSERYFSVLSVSLSFDIKLPNGKSTRHPDANRFIDNIRERLHQAIQVYEQIPMGK